jgi:hypothetical protein
MDIKRILDGLYGSNISKNSLRRNLIATIESMKWRRLLQPANSAGFAMTEEAWNLGVRFTKHLAPTERFSLLGKTALALLI